MTQPIQDSAHAAPRWLAYLLLATSMSLVGSYVALSKPLVAIMPIFLLGWLRFGIGALAMPHWLIKPDHEAPMGRNTKGLLFLESFLGNFMFTICMLFGVSMTTAVSAGIIMATIPTAVALLSWLILRERIGRRVWAAIALAASVWTVWLWMTGLKTIPAARAGVFTVMLPISAALVGVLFLGERLTGLQLFAFALCLAGVLLATLPERFRTNAPN